MARKTPQTITLNLTEATMSQLASLHDQVPVVTKHAVARAALLLGLEALTRNPGTLARWLVASRQRAT